MFILEILTFFSDYGYIQVKKVDYESENIMIAFVKNTNDKLNGVIKVVIEYK